VASLVAEYVKSGIRVVFWLIAASITAAAAFLAGRIILWSVQMASRALGL
jgi:hypothetical protein